MTAEEIDIVVNASVEKAVKEFEKLLPSIKKQLAGIKKEFDNANIKDIVAKIDVKTIKQQTKQVKKMIKEAFDPNDTSGMTINGKTFKIKNISGYSKEIIKLRGNIRQLKQEESEIGDIKVPEINKNETQRRSITGAKTMNIETPKISTWDVLSQKIKQIIPTINLVKSKVRDMFSDQKPNAELELLNIKISEVKTKLNNAKMNMDYKGVLEAEVELEKLNKKKQELEKGNKGNFFSSFFSSLKKAMPSMNNISGMTIKIKNTIKQWGGGMKQGLGHVLKYAGALFSLRSIYSTLSSSASSWLSSQNAQAQQLSANIDYMKYAMGSVFAPIIEYVTNLVYSLMKAIQSLVYAFSGVNIFAKATASSMNSASSSANKASKSLSGIHNEINNVSDNDSSGGSGNTSSSFDLSEMDNTPNSIIDAIKNGNWYEVGATIGQKLNEAMSSIPWDKIQETVRNTGTGIAQTLNGFIATTDWEQLGNTFAQGLNTVIYCGYKFINTFNWRKFGETVGDCINGALQNVDYETSSKTLSEGIQGILNSATEAVYTIDWEKLGSKMYASFTSFDWGGLFSSIFEFLGAVIPSIGEIIVGWYMAGWPEYEEWIKGNLEKAGGNVFLGFVYGIIDAFKTFGIMIYDNVIKPFVDGFKNALGIHSPSTLFKEFGRNIIQGLYNGLENLWGMIAPIFTNLVSSITGKFTEIKNNIVNWGNNIKSKISESWSNASNTVKEKVTNLKNNISTGLSNAKTTISNWGNNVKNTFTKLGEKASTWGKDLVSNMANGIKNNISKVTNAVNSVADKIKSFLHFTEPDEGPLSNFHTYMPDMIDLMAQGIHNNMSKVTNELENLTGTMSYTINTPDIDPMSIDTNIDKSKIQPQNVMLETLNDALANNEGHTNITIPLSVYISNQKLGQILLDDLRNIKRQTGQGIEALVGG